MLTCCRRPLVLNTTGAGAWRKIIIAVGYAVPFFIVMCISWSSGVVERYIYNEVLKTPNTDIYNNYKRKYNSFINFITVKDNWKRCSYPNMYEDKLPLNRYWEAKRLKLWFAFYFEHFFIIFGALLRWLMLRFTNDIKETKTCEREILQQYRVAKMEPHEGQ
ncbi:uncharacterized protein [Battus philenor]|uniref:uncharacterized protein n=1 Tax=Battus philenor TaxID=42288 RepID=UPI0035CEB9B6